MNILGIIFALAAGVFFGIIGPVTKTAYNLNFFLTNALMTGIHRPTTKK